MRSAERMEVVIIFATFLVASMEVSIFVNSIASAYPQGDVIEAP